MFLQSIVFCVILVLGLIAGGAASAANAANISSDLDDARCDRLDDYENIIPRELLERLEELCDDFETLRDVQAASAVSFHECFPSLQLMLVL